MVLKETPYTEVRTFLKTYQHVTTYMYYQNECLETFPDGCLNSSNMVNCTIYTLWFNISEKNTPFHKAERGSISPCVRIKISSYTLSITIKAKKRN